MMTREAKAREDEYKRISQDKRRHDKRDYDKRRQAKTKACLLYTSDAADE